MEFSVGYQIEARIENGRLVGKLTSKAGWDRAWSAVKGSGNTGTKDARPNVSNDVFGPWGNYENLRSAIVKVFNDKLDKAAAEGGYIANLKEDVLEDRPLSLGVYSVVNVMIADRLNKFFNKNFSSLKIFAPSIFVREEMKLAIPEEM